MILSRAKPAIPSSSDGAEGGSPTSAAVAKAKKKIPSLQDFLNDRDYTGATSLLDFERNSGKAAKDVSLWLGYSSFHAGDYKRALLEYDSIKEDKNFDKDEILLNLACTYFYLGMYNDADKALQSVSSKNKSQLKTRLQFHLSHKFADEKKLMSFHQELEDIVEDQLSLASIHYLRSHYQEAIDIYKRILLDNREYLESHQQEIS